MVTKQNKTARFGRFRPLLPQDSKGPALLSGPGALCVGTRYSLSRVGVGARRSSPKTLFSRYRRSVCRVWRFLSVCGGPTICVSGPGALCVETRRSVCRSPALFVSGPGALSIGLWRSLSGCVWNPDCFCIGARLFSALCRGPALSSGLSVSGQGALCRRGGPRCCRRLGRCLCEASAVSVSGPGHPSSPARSFFPGENPKPYCLGALVTRILTPIHIQIPT